MFCKLLLCFPLLVASAVVAQGLTSGPPPVKMGLWETTVSGLMGNSYKARVCITPDSYQNAFAHMPPGCTVSNMNRSATRTSADIACTLNNAQSTGHFDVTFPDPVTSHSTITINLSIQGQTQAMTIKTDGRFVSADCGSLEPGKAQIVH
jgi:hypothetical protein